MHDSDKKGSCFHISEETLACEDGDHERCECECGQHRHFLNADGRDAVMLATVPPKANT